MERRCEQRISRRRQKNKVEKAFLEPREKRREEKEKDNLQEKAGKEKD